MKPAPLDLAIIGAPKCGTSSLFTWLADHPGVQGTLPKETYYFMDAGHPLARADASYGREGWKGFEKFFPEDRRGRLRLEATPHNLYQKTAIGAFASLDKAPRLIVVLRRPSHMVRSSFYFSRNDRHTVDEALDFPTYVGALLAGTVTALRSMFRTDEAFEILRRGLDWVQYVSWLDAWSARIPKESIRLLMFDELSTNPRAIMQSLCREIGVDGSFFDTYRFDVANPTTHQRSRSLRRFAAALGPLIPQGRARLALGRLYRRMQRSRDNPESRGADEDALRKLDEHFAPWNARLAEAYGCNVGGWSAP